MESRTAYSEEQIRGLVQQAGDRAEEHYRLAVRPIYGFAGTKSCEHIGSSVLFEIDQRKVIITAAHVIDNGERMQLYVAGDSKLVPLGSAFFDTHPPEGRREADHIDVAFGELSLAQVRMLGGVSFVAPHECVPSGAEVRGRLFTALGFPNSRNKGPWPGGLISGRRYQYTASPRIERGIADSLGVSGRIHLFVDYQKLAHDEAGRRVSPIKPVGLSGGAVVESRVSKGAILMPRLAAITIERNPAHKVLVATKIAPIIEGIRVALAQ